MNNEDMIRMAQEAGMIGTGGAANEMERLYREAILDALPRFAALVAAAEQKATLDTVDELIGMERDRGALFSEGYDHALFHIKQFVEGRGRVK
jgi:hypothetical protein